MPASPASPASPVAASMIRVVAQSTNSANLLIDNISKTVNINRGVVFYLSFIGPGISTAAIDAAVSSLVNAKVFSFSSATTGGNTVSERPKATSIKEAGVDVLVIPQATLAGKLKGKNMQYHAQAPKEEGFGLFQNFCGALQKELLPPEVLDSLDANGVLRAEEGGDSTDPQKTACHVRVYNGTYGNRQALMLDSSGPMTHVFEF